MRYASLWGKRAVSYRREKGYDKPDTALAVVIQKMVNSEIAGVLFTMNPANGNREEVLINASYGLGESVVSGAVSPDELVCDRNGSVINSVVGQKATQVIYAETQTETVEVASEKRNQLSINENQIKRLVEKSLEIEVHYGMPMDIEWTFAEDRLYILQARAITTGADNTAGEIREDAMPPIMPVNQKMRQTLMFMLEKEPFAYYPLDFDFAMILGGQKQMIFAEAGVEMDNNSRMNEDGFMLLHMSQEELLCMRYSELQTMLKRGFVNTEEQKLIERRLSLRPTAEEYWKRQQWEACKGNGETLRGISGSTGRAEGKVCIVTSPAEFHKLNKGAILVCRYTDPEWTPLFSLAAAVVADTGGVLSHAAIVAREYKIPAVLAVGNATAVLKDGDRVLVDGSAGEIERI